MEDNDKGFFAKTLRNTGEVIELIGHLFDIAKPNRIFSEPVEAGDYTVITASELLISMGAGYGGGESSAQVNDLDKNNDDLSIGAGGGGGGGGFSLGRPVASIIIGPEGVHVEPIVDPTKISIAFFTTFAAIIMTLSQIRRIKRS